MGFKAFSSRAMLVVAVGFLPLACTAQRDGSSSVHVDLPSGWSVKEGSGGRAVIRATDPHIFALVQPVEAGSASDALAKVVGQFPGAQVSGRRQVSGESFEKVSFSMNGQSCEGNVLCLLQGGRGMVYMIAAPSDVFESKKAGLVHALQSFRYGGGGSTSHGGGRGVGQVSFRSWSDPYEGAFTTQVPEGWKTMGGAYRFGPVDIRRQVGLVSPGGEIHVQNGEATFPAFVTQGPSSRMRSLHDGQAYNVNGINYVVLSYMNGSTFSDKYVQLKLKKALPGMQISGSKDRPDIAQFVQGKLGGGQARASAGETDFTFSAGGQEFKGVCVATTITIGAQGPGMLWEAFPSYYIAPANELDTAKNVWSHLILDSRDSQEWTTRQSQTTAQFNQMVRVNHEATMANLHNQYVKASQQLDENFRGWDNTINGVEDVRSPSHGAWEAPAGHPYYWSNGSTVVGTDTANAPGIDFTPMERY